MKQLPFKKLKSLAASSLLSLFIVGCETEQVYYANLLRSDVFYQLYDDQQFDFLWVFDNSGSMSLRRDFIKNNMGTFVNILNSRKAIDFQMAVTTTDYMTSAGGLVQGAGNEKVVNSLTSPNVVTEFTAIMNAITDSPMSWWEQGLESAYKAIQDHGALFSRNGVPLVLIFVTDEEDGSCAANCFGTSPETNYNDVEHPVERYINYFSQYKAAQGTETHVFPIVGLDTNCAIPGVRYMTVADALGGVGRSGSICDVDLKNSFESIAQTISDRGTVFPLSSPSDGTGLRVYVNGTLIDNSTYEFDSVKNALVFIDNIPSSGSTIEVTYSQTE